MPHNLAFVVFGARAPPKLVFWCFWGPEEGPQDLVCLFWGPCRRAPQTCAGLGAVLQGPQFVFVDWFWGRRALKRCFLYGGPAWRQQKTNSSQPTPNRPQTPPKPSPKPCHPPNHPLNHQKRRAKHPPDQFSTNPPLPKCSTNPAQTIHKPSPNHPRPTVLAL